MELINNSRASIFFPTIRDRHGQGVNNKTHTESLNLLFVSYMIYDFGCVRLELECDIYCCLINNALVVYATRI